MLRIIGLRTDGRTDKPTGQRMDVVPFRIYAWTHLKTALKDKTFGKEPNRQSDRQQTDRQTDTERQIDR